MQVWCQPLQTLPWDKTLAISTKFKLNKEYNNGVTITLPKAIYVLVFIAYRFLQSVSRPSLYKLNATFRSSMSSHRHESCLTTCYIYSQFLVDKWSYFSKTNFLMTNRYRSAGGGGGGGVIWHEDIHICPLPPYFLSSNTPCEPVELFIWFWDKPNWICIFLVNCSCLTSII